MHSKKKNDTIVSDFFHFSKFCMRAQEILLTRFPRDSVFEISPSRIQFTCYKQGFIKPWLQLVCGLILIDMINVNSSYPLIAYFIF